MASSESFVSYICEILQPIGQIRSRKMFGDWMVYADDKPVVLVCDNVAYIKKLDCLADIMSDAECGIPYDGAKEHYILDADSPEKVIAAVTEALPFTKLPKKRTAKK